MSTNETTNEEKQEFTKQEHEELLKAAFERGASEKLRVMTDFLYEICEQFALSFKPPHGEHSDFLAFTIHTLQQNMVKKYAKPIEEDKKEEDNNEES